METPILKEGTMLAVLPERHPLSINDTIPLQLLASEPFILGGRALL